MLIIIGLASCQSEVTPYTPSIDELLAENGFTRTRLGKQLENPYSLENMKRALDTLMQLSEGNSNGKLLVQNIDIVATDLYVRFLPSDSLQYDALMKDSTLVYYEYPLDFEIESQGDVYIDPTLTLDQMGWQYTVVKPDYVFSDTIDYEILSELFIPENASGYVDQENDHAAPDGRIGSTATQVLDQLETIALYITNNLTEEEQDTIDNDGSSGRMLWRPSWWTPKGTVRVEDPSEFEILGLTPIVWQPIVGVKVTARRWFTIKEDFTNSNGYYQTGRFRGKVNYRVLWENYHFSIRENTWQGFSRQAWVDGPKQEASWNLAIFNDTERWFHATIFRAAHHYYYENIKGLKRPPLNGRWKPQMKIKAINNGGGNNGLHREWTRVLGVDSRIRIWRNSASSSSIYATTIHELAHASHWDMGASDFNKTNTKVKESWSRGVQWELTRMKYPSYKGRNWNTNQKDYTLVVADMIDGPTMYISRTNEGFRDSRDQVSGYTIRQIEDALRGKQKWNTWRDNIKNKYNNETEDNLDTLFKAYE